MTIELRDDQIESLPAGRELDALVAVTLFGWKWFEYEGKPFRYLRPAEAFRYGAIVEGDTIEYTNQLPCYSASDSDMCQVIDKLKENPEWDYFTLGTDDGEGWNCRTHPIRTASTLSASGETRALAVCRVALMWAKRRREHAQG